MVDLSGSWIAGKDVRQLSAQESTRDGGGGWIAGKGVGRLFPRNGLHETSVVMYPG